MNSASIDFETRSAAGFNIDPVTRKVTGAGARGKGGLRLVGTPVYATHPSTDINCLRYDLHDGHGVRGWVPGSPYPVDLFDHIARGGLVAAWNVTFEFWIWNTVGARKYGWPSLPLNQCRCDMARSRRYSMPGALGNAAEVLGTQNKDPEGKRLIQKLSRPHTPTKKRPGVWWTPANAWDDHAKNFEYCGQDVVAEDAAAARLPELTPDELATWQLDQVINLRGVQVDVDTLDAMIDVLDQATRAMTVELATVTSGAVGSASEVAKIIAWLIGEGVYVPDCVADTVEATLARDDLPPAARRVLEIRQALGSANVRKLATLQHQLNRDGRLRDQYSYCGADRTGRFSAGGVQLQNITAKGPKSAECESCGEFFNPGAAAECPHCGSFMYHVTPDWTVEAVESSMRTFRTRDAAHVRAVWGDVVSALCGGLRGLFIAKPDHDLVCCDFSAIEAVVAACLARCQWRIDVFSTHGKIYEQSAANATGIPFDDILAYKRNNGSHHPARKTIGKVRELAGGYGGWVGAWKNFGADQFMADDEIKADVLKWRDESPEIVEMWGGQSRGYGRGAVHELFGLEGAAINAVLNPGRCFHHIDISYGYDESADVLKCRLPSGRFLNYHRPRLGAVESRNKSGDCWQLTYEGWNSNPTKGAVGWQRLETYGGRLFENVVQAVSADIQTDAMKRVEAAGYHIVMHTHDEIVAEVPEGFGSVDEMSALMTERPAWGAWWPIRAAGWRHKRYQKD